MSLTTRELNSYFIKCLDDSVIYCSDTKKKPLCIDLTIPQPLRLRLYLYNSGNPPGGRPLNEYRIILNTHQKRGCRGCFDHSEGRIVLIAGYIEKFDIFVFWDSEIHENFAFNKNLQVKAETVLTALAYGYAFQTRLTKKGEEKVIAVTPQKIKDAIIERIDLMIKKILEG